MRYKKLGNTGLDVSELALGTWAIGGSGWGDTNKADCLSAIDEMIDCGVNIIDTAPAYNAGEAERVVGEAIQGKRDKLYLATKVGTWFIDGQYVKTLKREKIEGQLDESLRNLRTDYIDLYLIHWPDAQTPIEDTMEVLSKMKRDGKVGHIGVSNFSIEMIEEARKYGDIEVVQPQYSMVNRDAEPLLRWAHERGIGTMTYGSLGAGILTGAFRTLPTFAPTDNRMRFYKHFTEPTFSKVMRLLDTLDEVSAAHNGAPLAQVAINWNTQKPFVTTSIVGVRDRSEAYVNCASFDWVLTDAEMHAIDEAIALELG